jgi:hypothetical protein
MINFIIINDPFQVNQLDEHIIIFLKSKGAIYYYDFKFNLYNEKPKFNIKDLSFKEVAKHIYKTYKHLNNLFIITIEHASPFGLYFVNALNKKFPDKCKGIICYPFRLYVKESLERRVWKYKDNGGWIGHISQKYNIDDYMLKINNKRLQIILNNINTNNSYCKESYNILMMIVDYFIRLQYKRIPLKYDIPTYLFSRLDMDVESIIKLNFDRKHIAKMKQYVTEKDTLYGSMMWNFDRVKYDKMLIDLNNNYFLKINYIIAGINDIKKMEIIDAVKLMLN